MEEGVEEGAGLVFECWVVPGLVVVVGVAEHCQRALPVE